MRSNSGKTWNLGITALSLAYALAFTTRGADISWGNPAGGRWGDAANWVGGVLPGASDRAIVALPVTVEVDDNRSVGAYQVAVGATVVIRGNGTRGHATLSTGGVGEVLGTVRLDSAHVSYYANLAASGAGQVVIHSTGHVEIVSGTGMTRHFTGNLVNRGSISADAGFDATPQSINFSGGSYLADGGTITGAVYARTKAISTGASPPAASTILVANGCSLVSDIAAGYVVQVTGTGWGTGHGICSVPASITNHGTIRLASTHTSYYAQISGAAGVVITNAAEGTIHAAAGGHPSRYFTCGLTNDGAVSTEAGVTCFTNGAVVQRNGSITADGKWQHDSGSFTFTGGSSGGNVYCSGVTIDVANTVTEVSSFKVEHNQNVLVKNDSPAVTMTLEGNGISHEAVVHVTSDAVNRGIIRLDSTHTSYYSQLVCDAGVTLTNAATGRIEFAPNGRLERYLQGNLINQGQIIADPAFDSSPQSIIFSGGSYLADGGTITGAVYARTKAISTGASPPAASTILVANGCSLVSDIAAGYVVQVTGTGWGTGHGICSVPASITNHGTIRLASTHTSYYAQISGAAGVVITNAAEGTIHAAAGGNSNRYLSVPTNNDGLLKIEPGVLLTASSMNQSNTGVFESQIGGLTTNLYSRLAVSGYFGLDGTVRIARVNDFAPILGNAFQILTFGSCSHWISCGDVEGLDIGGNLRFNLSWNPTNLIVDVVDAATVPSDSNCDCQIDLTDLAAVLSNFGSTGGVGYADGDFDLDGDVDLADLAYLLSNYGASCY